MKCRWCGKEFEPRDHRVFCSPDCRYNHDNAKVGIRKKIERIAEKNGFNITDNKMKIIEAKLMLFRGKDYMRCPCKSFDESKYCGSEACLKEIQKNGVCCCGLFKKE